MQLEHPYKLLFDVLTDAQDLGFLQLVSPMLKIPNKTIFAAVSPYLIV